MTIRIGTLAFTLAICINFCELSASGRPRREPLLPLYVESEKPLPEIIKTIPWGNVRLQLIERPPGKVYSIGLPPPNNNIPTLNERINRKIKVHLAYSEELFFYAYMDPNRGIIAADLPWPRDGEDPPVDTDFVGLKRAYTFNYLGREIRVWIDGDKKVAAVELIKPTNIIPITREIIENGIRFHLAAGPHDEVFFVVYTFPDGRFVGVKLSPHYIPVVTRML